MYEYEVVSLNSSSPYQHEELINKYAQKGWVLVQVVQNYCYEFLFYFRR